MGSEVPTAAPLRPRNVVVILADDMGLASLHAEHGASGSLTPSLDALAAQGVSFTDAHSGSAVCSPTRYGLLTGRYAWRTRMKRGIVPKWGAPLIEPERLTLADVGNRAGLRSACIGKWHLGWHWFDAEGEPTRDPKRIDFEHPLGGGPREAGFDHAFGDDVPNWPPYAWILEDRLQSIPSGWMEEDDSNGVRTGPMTPGWELDAVLPELTRRCTSYIRERAAADEPFLLYFSMTSPHTPIAPSAEFRGRTGAGPYADFLVETDWSVGEVLRALDKAGVADNTLVVFTADNGTSPKANFEHLASEGIDLRGRWRGHKGDLWEGGHRVPFLVRWPGVIAPGTSCAEPVVLPDVMATVASVLCVDLPVEACEDGVSLVPSFRGEVLEPRAIVTHSSNGRFAIRDGRWKLCVAPGSGGWSAPRDGAARAQGLPELQLYDLNADLGERRNLVLEEPTRVEDLLRLLRVEVERVPNDGPATWPALPWHGAEDHGR
jgi:arylsulfatase A